MELRAAVHTRLLSQELQTLLGPVTCAILLRDETPMEELLPSLPPSQRLVDPATWIAVTVCLDTDELCSLIQILGKVALWSLEWVVGLS